ncbi:protein YIPF1 [Lycorma delicatula]|uniref:protein YIPF1 n=1 Tax=Lycorma delicatula TaxID=130591 RepID=UPI003F515ECC
MASTKTSKLIDIESSVSAESRLQFQDFPADDTNGVAKLDIDSSYSQFPSTSASIDDGLSKPLDDSDKNQYLSLLSIEYYQRLFDVNTDQVVERIIWAMIPKPGVNYLQHHIGSKPDLYGPFWICVTLVFTIAISGNLANFLQTEATHSHYHWKYDFHAVTFSASAIFAYAWILPVVLWAIIKWQGSQESHVGLIELLCVYGYSLSIYVPLSVLWVIQIGWLQWLLVLLGAAMSGSVLVTAVWPAFKDRSALLLAAILGFHLLLATGFMLYFFHAPSIAYYNSNTDNIVHPGTDVPLHNVVNNNNNNNNTST